LLAPERKRVPLLEPVMSSNPVTLTFVVFTRRAAVLLVPFSVVVFAVLLTFATAELLTFTVPLKVPSPTTTVLFAVVAFERAKFIAFAVSLRVPFIVPTGTSAEVEFVRFTVPSALFIANVRFAVPAPSVTEALSVFGVGSGALGAPPPAADETNKPNPTTSTENINAVLRYFTPELPLNTLLPVMFLVDGSSRSCSIT